MHDPIIVVGGGFGGVSVAKRLLKYGFKVLLISPKNHFTFTPLLHEVATGSLLTHDIIFEFESFFQSEKFEYTSGMVSRIDPLNKQVFVGDDVVSYSALVLATGSRTNERLIKGMDYGYELKNVEDAVAIKKAIIERAQQPDKSVSISVIGGGPTGCELVFDLVGLLRALKARHRTLTSSIRLIHAQGPFGGVGEKSLQTYIHKRLKENRIEILIDTFAQEITPTQIVTSKGIVDSDLTIVVAGVRPNTDVFPSAFPLDPKGFIHVNASLQVQGHEDVYALGDIITVSGMPVAQLAQTAVQEAQVVADNIHRKKHGFALHTYQPKLKGFLMSLGYGDAVGNVFGILVKGSIAWYLWRTVYLLKTPGFVNKLRVAFSWTIGLFQGRNITSL